MACENYLSPTPSHGIPGHPFLYSAPLRAPSPLLFSLPVPPPKSRDKHASVVWNASILLADKIASEEIVVEGKRVLEVGCGLGLPGIVAARKGASKVVLSDFDDEKMLLDTAHAVEEALPSSVQQRIEVAGHTWGTSIEPLRRASSSYDLILVADCVWETTLHAPLIRTLSALLAACPSAVIHFAAGFHTGRAVIAAFLAAAEEVGIVPLKREEWVEMSIEGEERNWDWGLREKKLGEEKQEERNRWTLYGTLGRGNLSTWCLACLAPT